MRAIIVDDEPAARELLRGYADMLGTVAIAGEFADAQAAAAFTREHAIDLVFLDVELGRLNGLEALRAGMFRGTVVLVTAHASFAVAAFDAAVTDFLLKPVRFERFAQAVSRARSHRQQPDSASIFVKSSARIERVAIADVVMIEGQDDYRCIHTPGRRVLTPLTFAELLSLLPPHRFVRVHKSYAVARDRISAVERNHLLIGSVRIPVSRSYRDRLLERIGHGAAAGPARGDP